MSAYRTEATVKLTFRRELDEEEANQTPLLESLRRRVVLVVALSVAVIGAVLMLRHGVVPGLIGAGVVGALLGWLLRRVYARRALEARYGATWEQRQHAFLEATDEELVVGDRLSRHAFAWETVDSWAETDAVYYVFVSRRGCHIIPKRAFPTPETATTFRQLLAARVGASSEIAAAARMGRLWLASAYYFVTLALVLGALVELVVALVP